jgi:hypothetical protein
MATLLADGGFAAEALPAVGDAACMALRGLAIVADPGLDADAAGALPATELAEIATVRERLPPGAIGWLTSNGDSGAADLEASRAAALNLLTSARGAIMQASGGQPVQA